MGLAFTDRVALTVFAEGDLGSALEAAPGKLADELLADSVEFRSTPPLPEDGFRDWEIEGHRLSARLVRAPNESGS